MIAEHRLRTVDGFNQRLMEAVRALRVSRPLDSLQPSNGWAAWVKHWPVELHSLVYFAQKHSDLIDPARLDVWANITENGQAIAAHDHIKHRGPPNKLAGVYYPHDSEAAIRFPELGLRIPIREGLLLLFQPELKHAVEPAEQERISIAFNAY